MLERIRIILLVILVTAVTGMLVLEWAARGLLKRTKLDVKASYVDQKLKEKRPVIGAFDDELGWGFTPNSSERFQTTDFNVEYRINAFGFRDNDWPFPPTDASNTRILALGESTVFGEGVDYGQRFTEVIEDRLKDVDVLNMGVWGFGADQSLLQLEREGKKFHPQIVILFAIKDFFERCKFYQRLGAQKPRFILSGDQLVLEGLSSVRKKYGSPTPFPNPLENASKETTSSITKKSALLTLLLSTRTLDRVAGTSDQAHWDHISTQLQEDAKKGVSYSQADFEKFVGLLLKRYQKVCQEMSAQFVFVYISSDKDYFSKYFSSTCSQAEMRCVNLSNVLGHAALLHPLTFSIDPHYNPSTHHLIGRSVADYLIENSHLTKR